jgi:hypothetical protein
MHYVKLKVHISRKLLRAFNNILKILFRIDYNIVRISGIYLQIRREIFAQPKNMRTHERCILNDNKINRTKGMDNFNI